MDSPRELSGSCDKPGHKDDHPLQPNEQSPGDDMDISGDGHDHKDTKDGGLDVSHSSIRTNPESSEADARNNDMVSDDEFRGESAHRRNRRHRRDRRRKSPFEDRNYSLKITGYNDDLNGDHGRIAQDENERKSLSIVSASKTNIIYATNISPVITLDQMRSFFGHLGQIENIELYHFDKSPDYNFKVCFVEFADYASVVMAKHLTNTIFIDRAIFILPFDKPKIPATKELAEELGFASTEYVSKFNPDVTTQVTSGPAGTQVITTSDSRLTAASLQQYPQLPINTDPTRIEEIRRTLYIGNLDSSQSPEQVHKFFNDLGEVKYIRVAGDETQPTRFAFVEFTHQSSVANALLHNGFVFGSRALKINHSNNPIVKPQPKLEIEDPKRTLDSRATLRDSSRRGGDRRHSTSRNERRRDRSRGHYDRRASPRDSRRSGRSRSRDRDSYARSRRSRSHDRSSRRSPDVGSRRRSRSRDSRKRRSRSRSSERRSKHKSSRRR